MAEISWKHLFCFLLLSLLHCFLLLHYGKYLSRQLKNHLAICRGSVFISPHLSALIFASRLYHRIMLYLELPLKTAYRVHLMLNAAAWLIKDHFPAGLMQTQLSAYYSRCVLKVSCVLESYTIPFILTSTLKQVRVGISNCWGLFR